MLENLKEHFLKLITTMVLGGLLYAGQAYVNEKHAEAMSTISQHALHIEFIREDLKDIKELLKEALKKK